MVTSDRDLVGDWLEFFGEPEPLILSVSHEKGMNGGAEEREERLSALSGSLQPTKVCDQNKSMEIYMYGFTDIL